MTRLRTASFSVLTALVVSGLALAGCGDAAGVEAGPVSVQTTEALDVLPASTPVVGMVNLAAARQSGATSHLLDGPGAGHGAELDEFTRLTGFDPSTDLDRVYLAASPERERGALVVMARFDRDRVERALGEQAGDELVRSNVEGVPLWTQRRGGGGALALPSDRMMFAGSEAEVRAMLERLARGTKGASADAELMALVATTRHRDGAWLVTRGVDTPMQGLGGPAGEAVESSALSVHFADAGLEVDAFLTPRPGADPADLADVVRGAVSAMRARAAADMLATLDDVDVDEEAGGVRLTASVPASMLEHPSGH